VGVTKLIGHTTEFGGNAGLGAQGLFTQQQLVFGLCQSAANPRSSGQMVAACSPAVTAVRDRLQMRNPRSRSILRLREAHIIPALTATPRVHAELAAKGLWIGHKRVA
jgi:hypothetical protein